MPLNRLVFEEVQYPANTDQAIPLVLQLKFDERFRPAVMQVGSCYHQLISPATL